MTTSAILNINNAAGPAPGKKANANASSDSSFNDVLSREVEQRKPVEPGKVKEKEKTKEKDSASTEPAAETVKAKPAEEAKARDGVEATDAAAETATATPDSADLLALVANLAQVVPTATPATAEAVEATVSTIDPDAKATATDATAALPLAAAPDEDATAVTEARVKPGDFAQAAKAADPKASLDMKAVLAEIEHTASNRGGAKPADLPQTAAPAAIAAVSQGTLNQLQANGGVAASRLTPHVGTPAWDNALAQKVVWMATGTQQSASLTLNPPDLGPLQVVLNVSNSQATATFTAAQPEVRQALENAMPKLREMMSEAGIQLGQANVSAGTPGQQEQFAEQQRGNHRSERAIEVTADALPRVTRGETGSAGQGLINTFA